MLKRDHTKLVNELVKNLHAMRLLAEFCILHHLDPFNRSVFDMIPAQMLMLLNVLNLPTCPTGFALLQLCEVVFALIVLTQPSRLILRLQTLRLPDS